MKRTAVLAFAFALTLAASACRKPRGQAVGGAASSFAVDRYDVDVPPPATSVAVKWLPPTVGAWRTGLERVAAENHVDADLLAIVVLVESGGDPKAKSPSGALGLMQILPLTGRHIANERKLTGHSDRLLTNPDYNLDFGAWYLGTQLATFRTPDDGGRSVDLAAAAYNAGPGRLKRHLRGDDTLTGETQRYIRWVGGMWRERFLERSDTYAAWWQAGGSHLVQHAAEELGVTVTPPT